MLPDAAKLMIPSFRAQQEEINERQVIKKYFYLFSMVY